MSTGGMPVPAQAVPGAVAAPPQADVGGALLPDVAPGGWKAWVSRPENRAALVQAGIQMLQPLGVGETPLSRAGVSVGAGMEARDRVVNAQQEQQQQTLQNQLAQQEADARSTAANASMISAERTAAGGGLTAYQRLMQDNRTKQQFLKWASKRAADSQYETGRQYNTSNPDDVEALAQEYTTMLNGAPGGSAPAAPTPTLATALPGAPSTPPPHHVEYLKAHANDPKVVADFEAKYPGQSAAILTPAM